MRKGSPQVKTKKSMEKMRERTGEEREITEEGGNTVSVLANFTHTHLFFNKTYTLIA